MELSTTFESLPADVLSIITSFMDNGHDIKNLCLAGSRILNTKLQMCGGVIKLKATYKMGYITVLKHKVLSFAARFEKLQELTINVKWITRTLDASLRQEFESLATAESVSLLPASLKHFTLTGLVVLTDDYIAHLPRNLVSLKIPAQALSDACIPHLPRTLTDLRLNNSNNLTDMSIAHLPRGLIYLKLGYCVHLTDDALLALPQTLTHLCLSGGHLSDDCTLQLPRGLRHLEIRRTAALTDACIPGLPPVLEYLHLDNRRAFTVNAIAHLPRQLTHLTMAINTKLTDDCIRGLPATLKHLNLEWNRDFAHTGVRNFTTIASS